MDRPGELDDVTAERLLRGEVDPADAPPGYETLAALVRAARQPASRQERMTLPALPYAYPVVPAATVALAGARGRRGFVPAAAAALVVTLGAGAAAAATGTLPGPVQRVAARAADSVGVDLPDGTPDEPGAVAPAPVVPVGPPASVPVGPPSSVPVASPPVLPPGADVTVVGASCTAFVAGSGQDLGLLGSLYRIATGNATAEVDDVAAARLVVAELCAAAETPLPPDLPASPPGQEQTPPGQEQTPPGQEQTPPGQEQTPPGQEQTPPGQGQTPPGQGQTPPGQGQTPPGQGQTPPGQEQTPPGQGQTPPSVSPTLPDQAKGGPATPPSAPGRGPQPPTSNAGRPPGG